MPADTGRRGRHWVSGAHIIGWFGEERAYAALLDALTRDRLSAEAVDREMHASPRRSLADVQKDQERAARDELAEARREVQAFRAALQDIRARGGPDGRAEVPYDDQDPQQNQQAELLIQYLVRPSYAEVRTEEPDAGHYIYYIRVDWDRLRALAEEQGHPLSL